MENKNNNNIQSINYFKIYSFLVNIIKPILIRLFKDRWYKESNQTQQWKSSGGFGVFLADKFQQQTILFTKEQKVSLDSGLLESWDIELISIILQKFNYSKLDKTIIEEENKQILKIKLYYLKIKKLKELKQFYFEDYEEVNKIFKILKESLLYLEPDNSIKEIDELKYYKNKDIGKFKEEQLELYQDFEYDETDDDIDFFLQLKKDMDKEIQDYIILKQKDYYGNVIEIGDEFNPLSNYYCNKSNILLTISKYYSNQSKNIREVINKKYLLESIECAIQAILHDCCYYEGYYRLGRSLEYMGSYEMAMKCYNDALKLNEKPIDLNESHYLLQEKISLREYDKVTGKRNIKKELENYIREYDFKNEPYFKHYSNDSAPLFHEPFKSQFRQAVNKNKISGHNGNKELLEAMATQVDGLLFLSNEDHFEKAFRVLCKSAAYGLPLSLYTLYTFYKVGLGCDKDEEYALAVQYQASLNQPQPTLTIPGYSQLEDQLNHETEINYHLAKQFWNGEDNQDMDLEKSLYFFEKSVECNEKESIFEFSTLLLKKHQDPLFDIPKDEIRGLELLKKSSDLGFGFAKILYQNMRNSKLIEKIHIQNQKQQNDNGKIGGGGSSSGGNVKNNNDNEDDLQNEILIEAMNNLKNSKFFSQPADDLNKSLGQILMRDQLNEECSIDYVGNVARLNQLSKEQNSKMATKLVYAIGLLTKFKYQLSLVLKNKININDQKQFENDQYECIETLSKLYLLSESYVAYQIPLEDIDEIVSISKELLLSSKKRNEKIKKELIVVITCSKLHRCENQDERNEIIKILDNVIIELNNNSSKNSNNNIKIDNLDYHYIRARFLSFNGEFKKAIKDYQYIIDNSKLIHHHHHHHQSSSSSSNNTNGNGNTQINSSSNCNGNYPNEMIHFYLGQLLMRYSQSDAAKSFENYISNAYDDAIKVGYCCYFICDNQFSINGSKKIDVKKANTYFQKGNQFYDKNQLEIFKDKIQLYVKREQLERKLGLSK